MHTGHNSDRSLSAEQLSDKYAWRPDGHHPAYSYTDWRDAVLSKATVQSYWHWVKKSLCDLVAVDDGYEHPIFKRSMWRDQVAFHYQHIQSSYDQWVEAVQGRVSEETLVANVVFIA